MNYPQCNNYADLVNSLASPDLSTGDDIKSGPVEVIAPAKAANYAAQAAFNQQMNQTAFSQGMGHTAAFQQAQAAFNRRGYWRAPSQAQNGWYGSGHDQAAAFQQEQAEQMRRAASQQFNTTSPNGEPVFWHGSRDPHDQANRYPFSTNL